MGRLRSFRQRGGPLALAAILALGVASTAAAGSVAGQVTRWPSNMAPFWRYTPLGGIQEWGGVGQTFQRAFSQAEMALCIPPGGCEQYQYPWMDQTVHPNGTVSGDSGA